MSDLTQILGLAVQNFLSAATGMALAAFIRGFVRKQSNGVGNFRVDRRMRMRWDEPSFVPPSDLKGRTR